MLGNDAFDQAWREGRAAELEDVVRDALDGKWRMVREFA